MKNPLLLPARKTALAFMHARLELSGLTRADAKALALDPGPAPAELGLPPGTLGFAIPYYDPARRPLPTYRFRIDRESLNGWAAVTEPRKYTQPAGTRPEVYLCPIVEHWAALLADPTVPLVITEGELKAAAGIRAGFWVIGLGGVENWHSRRLGMELLPVLERAAWTGREVFICFDSDAATNPNVLRAESKLVTTLVNRGAVPRVIRLPLLPDATGDAKVGLDDYLKHAGAAAFKQLLQDAQSDVLTTRLAELNSEVAYITELRKIYEFKNGKFVSRDEFINGLYAPWKIDQLVTTGTTTRVKSVSVAKVWMECKARTTFDALNYLPGKPEVYTEPAAEGKPPRTLYNTWPGFAVAAARGDVTDWLTLLRHLTAGEGPKAARYLEQWFGYPIKYPGTKLFTAAVIWSPETGTGKSLLGESIGRIYGPNYSKVTKDNLESRFNTWSEDKQYVVGSEITGDENRKFADKLKEMITGQEHLIERKGVDAYYTNNCINYYFTSNHSDAFFLDDNDRRFFIIQGSDTRLSPEFYRAVTARYMLSRAGAAALRWHFENAVDYGDFNPTGEAPVTGSKITMQESARSGLAEWIVRFRDEPHVLLPGSNFARYRTFTREEVYAAYRDTTGDSRTGVGRAGNQLLANGFAKLAHGYQVQLRGGRKVVLWGRKADVELFRMRPAEAGKLYARERTDWPPLGVFSKEPVR